MSKISNDAVGHFFFSNHTIVAKIVKEIFRTIRFDDDALETIKNSSNNIHFNETMIHTKSVCRPNNPMRIYIHRERNEHLNKHTHWTNLTYSFTRSFNSQQTVYDQPNGTTYILFNSDFFFFTWNNISFALRWNLRYLD